jgi:hypothetical protein
MHTIVVNGEPVVFGDHYGPQEFRRLLHETTESDYAPDEESVSERICLLHQQSRAEIRAATKKFNDDGLLMRLSENSFGFVAMECCLEHPMKRFDSESTVSVLKSDKQGGTYRSHKKVHGCQCNRCNNANIWNSCSFLREHGSVQFKI